MEGDAGLIDRYRSFAPADVVLACGVFGNITDADDPGLGFGVGAHRRVDPPEPFAAGSRMFTFVGSAALRAS